MLRTITKLDVHVYYHMVVDVHTHCHKLELDQDMKLWALVLVWRPKYDHMDNEEQSEEGVGRADKHHDGTAVHSDGSHNQVP